MLTDNYYSKAKSKEQNIFRVVDIAVVLVPILFYFIPLEYLDHERSFCVFKNITGKECYGCGITKAIISVIQFKWTLAFRYNRLVIIVFPCLFILWIKIVRKMYYTFSQVITKPTNVYKK